MNTCKACGASCRTTVIALVLSPGQSPKGRRVCQKCARSGMLVVVAQVDASSAERSVAKFQRQTQREVLAPFIKALLRRVAGMKAAPVPLDDDVAPDEMDMYQHGRQTAFEDLIYMLKEGRV